MKSPWNPRVRNLLPRFSAWFDVPVRRPAPTKLRVELLEDRTAPATLTVTSSEDLAALTPGTLRYEVNQANADANMGQSDTIVFSGVSSVTLLQGQLQLTGQDGGTPATITIDGTITGGGRVTVSGNDTNSVLHVSNGYKQQLATSRSLMESTPIPPTVAAVSTTLARLH